VVEKPVEQGGGDDGVAKTLPHSAKPRLEVRIRRPFQSERLRVGRFRGLLKVHSRYGPLDRSTAQVAAFVARLQPGQLPNQAASRRRGGLRNAGQDRVMTVKANHPGIIVEAEINGRTILFFVLNIADTIQNCHLNGQFYENEELAIVARHFKLP
jgi:hypothetical protein